MLRKFAVAAALACAALVVTAPVGSAATGPGSGGAPGTTAPAPGTAPKATTPYYYAWYTSQSAAQKVCNDKLGSGQWRACAVQAKSGLYYVWFNL
ncbi:hypothetical protein AMES_7947 [Amycolatopsis mediterranei S699]|uniref:Secreted protein n=2 Tax=Amycolatopsis mediterranei TaxID=33910 RepID=A0A0H3DGF2_AMYMU|nr:hypothetical protein [Amycolatopsis mediterranei]ADJ49771.1 hypothetical protein AMED_8068 [Amycolatopsis mediterranei U32]AEK46758.1 hypothetical protein RAM_41455 [Amycolatopsis mediterranei S699]AFO81480.1 hypothetical protein AMES_7947 [Amycolatopsis mediterranei S699]AGT88609.1 hypothetical protein B737_7948 [Amycolatopsis mediterranei RB]KDO07980.1 hypothetical protein DV26_27220 [Amycolatopsis mediterranei]